jgi:hypothetical protein
VSGSGGDGVLGSRVSNSRYLEAQNHVGHQIERRFYSRLLARRTISKFGALKGQRNSGRRIVQVPQSGNLSG